MELRMLPEDVETEILVRLSTLELLKCLRVCRRWKDLISSQYFQNKHLIQSKKSDSPTTIIFDNAQRKLIIYDKSEKRGEIIVLKDFPNPQVDNFSLDIMRITFCYDGFIVSEGVINAIIYNPVTREVVELGSGTGTGTRFQIYAMFFDQWINKYCVILLREGSHTYCYDKFELLHLGSQPYRHKTLKTLDSMRNQCYYSRTDTPVVINNANIYWQLGYRGIMSKEFILTFNIKSEKFCFWPDPRLSQPQQLQETAWQYCNVHIADIHDCLSLVQFTNTISAVTFNIWTTTATAAEEAPPKWIEIHNVVINLGLASRELNPIFRILTIRDGEIVFENCIEAVVYVYNLQQQQPTLRTIFYDKIYFGRFYHYVPSFASVTNF